MDQQAKVGRMSTTDEVPEQRRPTRGDLPVAAIAETHCAVVVFVGDRAYKVKKPVDLGFLDFRTVEGRERVCRRELDLNRRLAPDVYLGLDRLVDDEGRTRDWIVVMRRMPADRRLSTLVRQGADVRDALRTLARMLAAFHADARTGPEVAAAGRPSALRRRWTDNFDESSRFAGSIIDRSDFDDIVYLALRYVDGRDRLLDERVREGFIVDGHGDLLTDDIFCLPDHPRVLDCLEFDDTLRYVDGIDDAAFLAMDLEHLGASDLGQQFLRWYQEFTVGQVPQSLVHHYVAYRAFVRAKVACLRAEQGATQAPDTARTLADLALRHLRASHVRLVLVGGLPGTGKSTVAAGLAEQMGAVVLQTDEIRRELPGAPDLERHGGYGHGLYERSHVRDAYRELLVRAQALVEHGESVVLDATWSDPDMRREARELAGSTATTLVELRCTAPPAVTGPRLRDRVGGLSDATQEVAARMREHFAPWPEATSIDTSGGVDTTVGAAFEAAVAPS